MKEPIQQANAIGINIRTNNTIAQCDILIIIKFTQRFASVIEGCSILKIVFGISALLAREDAVSTHVNYLSVCSFCHFS